MKIPGCVFLKFDLAPIVFETKLVKWGYKGPTPEGTVFA